MNMDILVSICIVTYNQEKFISKAIESILHQETNYNYEIIIGEDVSTDRTREICIEYKRKFPDRIRLILHEKNLGLVQNFLSVVKASEGDFIALCDGDDYWTASQKLQTQTTFLINNPEVALVHTNKAMIDEDSAIYYGNNDHTGENSTLEKLLINNFICVSTVMLRKKHLMNFFSSYEHLIIDNKWKMQDYPLWLYLALKYKIAYLSEEMSMYRVLSNSLCRQKDRNKSYLFDRSILDIRLYFYSLAAKQLKYSNDFKYRFWEMVFHYRKRMIIKYKLMASKEFFELISSNPVSTIQFLYRSLKRNLLK